MSIASGLSLFVVIAVPFVSTGVAVVLVLVALAPALVAAALEVGLVSEAVAAHDRLLQRWVSTAAEYTKQRSRTVAYLSAEFLLGPHLGNNLINLGIYGEAQQAITELGLDFDGLLQQEEEPGHPASQ